MYYKITVSCKYKKRIHDLLRMLKAINQKKKELFEKWSWLLKDLLVVKEIKTYKAVKGDLIDEMWCEILNKANLDLDVVRTAPGKYLFGTKNIVCKIVNGKLLVRVGGGFMSAEEFVDQYGQVEMVKAMKTSGNPDYESAKRSLKDSANRISFGSPKRTSVNTASLSDLKKIESRVYNDSAKAVNTASTSSPTNFRRKRSTGAA